jgi:hypothetical protein
MKLLPRSVVALLSGMGSGVIGFWGAWKAVEVFTGSYPGDGHNVELLAGIFAPFVVTALLVFHGLSQQAEAAEKKPA